MKKVHFRLTCVAQKRLCLSSLLARFDRHLEEPVFRLINRWPSFGRGLVFSASRTDRMRCILGLWQSEKWTKKASKGDEFVFIASYIFTHDIRLVSTELRINCLILFEMSIPIIWLTPRKGVYLVVAETWLLLRNRYIVLWCRYGLASFQSLY